MDTLQTNYGQVVPHMPRLRHVIGATAVSSGVLIGLYRLWAQRHTAQQSDGFGRGDHGDSESTGSAHWREDFMLNIQIGVKETAFNGDSDFQQSAAPLGTFAVQRTLSRSNPSLGEFKFKCYAPGAFERIRSLWNVTEGDYRGSVCANLVLSERPHVGGGDEFTFYTHDLKYSITTISKKQLALIRRILPAYYEYAATHPETLLPKIYGLYTYQPHRFRRVHFVVVSNPFYVPPWTPIHQRLSLTGYTRGRQVPVQDLVQAIRGDLPWQDNDIVRQGLTINLGSGEAKRLQRQLRLDAQFLHSCKITGYTVLVAIHRSDDKSRHTPKMYHCASAQPDMKGARWAGPGNPIRQAETTAGDGESGTKRLLHSDASRQTTAPLPGEVLEVGASSVNESHGNSGSSTAAGGSATTSTLAVAGSGSSSSTNTTIPTIVNNSNSNTITSTSTSSTATATATTGGNSSIGLDSSGGHGKRVRNSSRGEGHFPYLGTTGRRSSSTLFGDSHGEWKHRRFLGPMSPVGPPAPPQQQQTGSQETGETASLTRSQGKQSRARASSGRDTGGATPGSIASHNDDDDINAGMTDEFTLLYQEITQNAHSTTSGSGSSGSRARKNRTAPRLPARPDPYTTTTAHPTAGGSSNSSSSSTMTNTSDVIVKHPKEVYYFALSTDLTEYSWKHRLLAPLLSLFIPREEQAILDPPAYSLRLEHFIESLLP